MSVESGQQWRIWGDKQRRQENGFLEEVKEKKTRIVCVEWLRPVPRLERWSIYLYLGTAQTQRRWGSSLSPDHSPERPPSFLPDPLCVHDALSAAFPGESICALIRFRNDKFPGCKCRNRRSSRTMTLCISKNTDHYLKSLETVKCNGSRLRNHDRRRGKYLVSSARKPV